MERIGQLKQELIDITTEISSVIDGAAEILPDAGPQLPKWRSACAEMETRIADDRFRVAVVGAIKSGKSTFVNALLGDDYLKRGAGVVTSMVTRIQAGPEPRAVLRLKSWDAVNDEMRHAMNLLPEDRFDVERRRTFEVRDDADRERLADALAGLGLDQLILKNARHPDSALLSAYLSGYPKVADIVGDEPGEVVFDRERFADHRAFAGDDALAVYLTDIRVEVPTGDIENGIEIADCQGSDSPNPLHLAMIQDYLRKTHLILYVVSSRTGLRQADIGFLNIIRGMGLIDHILFVVNADFGEHESLDDLQSVARRVREEVSLIAPSPKIFVLSALYNLFRLLERSLSVRDRMRLGQWRAERSMASFCDAESQRFQDAFRENLFVNRMAVALGSHADRIQILVSGVGRWLALRSGLLARGEQEVAALIDEMKQSRHQADELLETIRHALDGAASEIKRSLRPAVDTFFDGHAGITGEVLRFVWNVDVDYNIYAAGNETGVSSKMYMAYQEIKRQIDGFMAETINPLLLKFLRERETDIHDRFAGVVRSHETTIRAALGDFGVSLEKLGVPAASDAPGAVGLPDIETVAREEGIAPPKSSAPMQYSVTVRSEALARFGLFRVVRFFRELFRREAGADDSAETVEALKYVVARLREETESALKFHMKDLRENLKFQYLFRLVDAVKDHAYAALAEYAEAHLAGIDGITQKVDESRSGGKDMTTRLREMEARCEALQSRISEMRRRIGDAFVAATTREAGDGPSA